MQTEMNLAVAEFLTSKLQINTNILHSNLRLLLPTLLLPFSVSTGG